MNKTAKYLLFWLLGLGLLFLAFRRQDFSVLWQVLVQEADYRWAGLILVLSVLNHVSRARRWQLLLGAAGHQAGLWPCFQALMTGYLVNYAVPRLGEVSRCAALWRSSQVPAAAALGTVVIERVADLLCLGTVVLLALLFQWPVFSTFFLAEVWPAWEEPIERYAVWAIAVAVLLLLVFGTMVYGVWRQRMSLAAALQRRSWGLRVWSFGIKLWSGMQSIAALRQRFAFLAHTIFIWTGYWLMTWLWCFSFEATAEIPPSAGLGMMVFGSIGRLLPIQGGGIGAYHYIFAKGASLFGVPEVYANALAILIHGLQTLLYLIVGGFCTLSLYRNADAAA